MEGLQKLFESRGTKRRSAVVVMDFLSPRFNTDAAAAKTEFFCDSPRKARVGAGEEEEK